MNATARLSLPEELILIALDDTTGMLAESGAAPFSLDLAVSGAVLMELAIRGRIDSDSQAMFPVSSVPTGAALLDEALAELAASPTRENTTWWLKHIAAKGHELRERLIESLVGRGILRREHKRLLWVFKVRAYPPTTGIEEREVKARLTALLYGTDIPDPRDAMLVGLLDATGLFATMFTRSEIDNLRPRIEQIARLEALSRSLSESIRALQVAIASALAHGH